MRSAAIGVLSICLALAIVLSACAPEVTRQPATLTPLATQPGASFEVLKDTEVSVSSLYRRTIRAGSVWTLVGRTAQGEVYKPVNVVFTVEGTHVHEAYLVMEGDRLLGFYLPVERAFAPVPDGSTTNLVVRRRSP